MMVEKECVCVCNREREREREGGSVIERTKESKKSERE